MTDCQILVSQILPGLSSRFNQFNPTLTAENCCQYDATKFTCDGSRISAINLADSGLDGGILPELGSLNFLQTLVLSNNLLQGGIPDEIGLLGGLTTLALDRNHLMTGRIPDSLANINSLRYLDFKSTGFQGPLPPTFANKTYTTGTLDGNACPYESWLCTGVDPPRQIGCESVCLQIAIQVVGDRNGPARTTTSATSTAERSSILGISPRTSTTTMQPSLTPTPGIVVNANSVESSTNSYLNYVIPISIAVVCAVLALIYRRGRKNYVVGGKAEVNGSIESLARESTRIKESVLDRDNFGGFRLEVGEVEKDEEMVQLPQKDYVSKLFNESLGDSEVDAFLKKAREPVPIELPIEPIQVVVLGEDAPPCEESRADMKPSAQSPESDKIEVKENHRLHPHQSTDKRFSFESFHSFKNDN